MKSKELFRMLALANGVVSKKWETVMQLVDLIAKGEAKAKFCSYKKYDLSDINSWSTYEDKCIDLRFSNRKNILICEARIYDGESFDGTRTRLRFEALIKLPELFIYVLERRIELAFETYLENAYEEHLEAQKKIWIKNRKYEITKCYKD